MVQLRVLVTGASGFVGRYLCDDLRYHGYQVTGVVRRKTGSKSGCSSPDIILGPELDADSDWSSLLKGQDLIVHTAARVHVMHDTAQDPYQAFRAVNVDGTLALARQAAAASVKRFVFISSIKVNGEETQLGQPFTEEVSSPPTDPYGLSKYEAELALLELAKLTGMEVVIIRPPLVYGEGVKGNFASIMSLLAKGYPLPFGAIHNRRSLLSLDNLIDFITVCISHPAAANQVFLVSDGVDLSTTELLVKLSSAMGKQTKLLPIPEMIMRLGLCVIGKTAISQRLFSSLQVDITKAKRLLNWVPIMSIEDGLKQCTKNNKRDNK